MTVLRIQNLADFPDHLKGGVVAIGNFDGVHRGHQSVLCAAVNLAKANNVSATVLTSRIRARFSSPMNRFSV